MKKKLALCAVASLFAAVNAIGQLVYIGNGIFEFESNAKLFELVTVPNQSRFGQIEDFGYYFVDDTNHSLYSIAGKNSTTGQKLNGYTTLSAEGEFSKGTRIGFYAKGKKDATAILSTESTTFYGQAGNANSGKGGGEGNDYFVIGDQKWPSQGKSQGGEIAFQTYGTYTDEITGLTAPILYAAITVDPEEENYDSEKEIEDSEENKVNGRPLPGVLATLVLGATGFAALRHRKQNKKESRA